MVCGKSQLFGVFPNIFISFVSIVYIKLQIFWKNHTEYPEFSEYFADKTLEL